MCLRDPEHVEQLVAPALARLGQAESPETNGLRGNAEALGDVGDRPDGFGDAHERVLREGRRGDKHNAMANILFIRNATVNQILVRCAQ